MRAIDEKRLIAMNEIEMRGDSISLLARQYGMVYRDEFYQNRQKMDILDDIWKLITEHQVRLTEILRENGI